MINQSSVSNFKLLPSNFSSVCFGILGFARIAKNEIIPAILKSSNATIGAVASRDTAKLDECKKMFDVGSLYDSYDALLDDTSINAVYIPLPNSMHKEWAIKAMKRGKHVLCEKPISLTADECSEMISVAQENQCLLMEAFMYRYTDRIRKLKQIIDSNIIGEIKQINSTYRFFLDRPNTIKIKPELGGGSLYDVGSYPVNFTGMLMNTLPVSAKVECFKEHGVDTQFTGILKYESGVIATVNCGFNAFKEIHSRVTGTKGVIDIPDTFAGTKGCISVITSDKVEIVEVDESDRYLLEIENFANALLGKKSEILSMEETLQNAKVIDMLRNASCGV